VTERPARPRPLPPAPFDDPSIPVLTERLLLPEMELDTTLPAATADLPLAAQASAAPADAPPSTPPPDTAPQVLGVQFETDPWLVETTPVTTPVPPAGPQPQPPVAPGIAPAVAIPASLMRAVAAAAVPDVAATTTGATAATQAPPGLPGAEQLSASILDELLRQLPPDSEPIVRRHLAPAVDAAIGAAVAQIVPEIRGAVGRALRELVVQAVQAELARLRDRSRS